LLIQNRKGFAADCFLEPAAGSSPVHPFADATSQRPSRNRRRLIKRLADSMDRIRSEFKATCSHSSNIGTEYPRGQVCFCNKQLFSTTLPTHLHCGVKCVS
jgi:hypothetical protein